MIGGSLPPGGPATREVFKPEHKCDPSIFISTKLHPRFYHVEWFNNNTVVFKCLINYHRSTGNMVFRCMENGTWSGVEPNCEVDFYMAKHRLSAFIIGLSLLIPLILLSIDFMVFVRKRRDRRNIFVKKACPYAEYKRIMGESGRMSIRSVREAIMGGIYDTEDETWIVLSSSSGAFDVDRIGPFYSAGLARTQNQPKAHATASRHMADPKLKPDISQSGHMVMFGAGRHLAKLGKTFWDT